jgi:PAS domain S-box-containing protein
MYSRHWDEMSLINYKNETYPSGLNEVQMEQLYSKVDILYLVVDPEGGIASCNSTFLEAFDTEKELILGKNFLDLVRPDLRENLHSEIAKCDQRGYIREIQTVLCPRLRKPIHARLNGLTASEPDGKNTRIRLFIRDVTAQTRAEQRKGLLSRLAKTALQQGRHERLVKEILADVQKTQECDGIGLSLRKSAGEKQCLGNWKSFECPDAETDFRRWTPDRWKMLADRLETGVPSDTLREKRILLSDIGESSTLPSNPKRFNC